MAYMREAGLVVAAIHKALADACAPGVRLRDLDHVVGEVTAAHDAEPNFLHYQGFPANVCISVNEEIVHGIPSDRKLKDGDIVSFDCGARIREDGKWWHGDAAFTTVVGDGYEELEDLSRVTEGSMWAGIAALSAARRINDIGVAIDQYVAENSPYGLIEGYTGHGIGNELHEGPTVYNYPVRGRSEKVKPGMVLCIEPMVVAGDIATDVLADDWTVVTKDGSPSAHWEHTVAVLPGGISVLTAFDSGAAGLKDFDVEPVVVTTA
ncbi:type I methionyl aminopeptidase [Actinomycetaceae bacterium WB03_NA08]|uniref:Methionine aminopeptidase n=2 Tax=Scrofimicrobium canadense TaxID=2652290 RepID=A0A6N7W5S8_9ACTO|nr:type I methionyl aminopeptidase [Scrofimicrobium canadense]